MREGSVPGSCCLIALGLTALGCLPSLEDLDEGPLRESFAVSDVYTPSGYMGDGAHFGQLTGTTNVGCKPRPPGARGNCYVFTYYPNALDETPWAGVYWVFPANSWGKSPGHAIDVTKFKQVRFYAAVEAPMPFTYEGGTTGSFGAFAGQIATDATHPDGLRAAMSGGEVGSDVTTELKQFHIPLGDFEKGANCVESAPPGTPLADCIKTKGADGSDVLVAAELVGGFGWSIPYPTDATACLDGTDACRVDRRHSSQYANAQPVRVYLDDIVWDTAPAP